MRHQLSTDLRDAAGLAGRNVLWHICVSIAASVLLAGVEAVLAGSIEMMLRSLGVIAGAGPGILGIQLSLGQLGFLLVSIGLLRGIAFSYVAAMPAVVESLVAGRLRQLSLFDMVANMGRGTNAADVGFHFVNTFANTGRFYSALAGLISTGVLALLLLMLMLGIDWQITALASLGVLICGLAVTRVNQVVRRLAQQQNEPMRAMLAGVQRVTANWMLIRTLRMEQAELHKLVGFNVNGTSHMARSAMLTTGGMVLSTVLGIGLLAVLLQAQSRFGTASGSAFVALLYLLMRLVQLLNNLVNMLGNLATRYPAYREALAYYRATPTERRRQALAPSRNFRVFRAATSATTAPTTMAPVATAVSPPKVEVDTAYFGYDATRDVLAGISLTVGAGEQLGIVGGSGSGKTTLLGLILGIHQPRRGAVRLDGMPPARYFEERQTTLGYVGAEPMLFEGTLKENLDYGQQRPYTAEEYAAAFKAVRLDPVIARLHQGLEFRLNEGGGGFSAGEKQRLALARALLLRPPFLVFDEFTANLDPQTEAEITDVVAGLKGQCTVLIVSHKPAALKHADRILDLDACLRQTA